jgi:hypothetical protein
MSNEVLNIKKNWTDQIISHIVSNGFNKAPDGYIRLRVQQLPGQTISINGQVMHQPGGTIEIEQCIYFMGEGWVANEDETNKQEFTQIKFETYQGDDLIMQFEEAFYWDNPNYFIEIFNQVFNN